MLAISSPDWEQVTRVLTLSDYNTRVVVLGTTALGMACGLIGSFMLLRKRALMADAVSHATLPGIGLAFIAMVSMGGDGKWLPGLLLGALATGLLGMGLVLLVRNVTRIKEDAALGIVLSVFFGMGVAILGLIQKMKEGSAAGLESFIYGKTASMLASDAYLIGSVALLSLLVCGALFKEFTLLCFDQDYGSSQGFPMGFLDVTLMTLVVVVTVIGLQAVGLILVIALLIIPPASARFWTDKLAAMSILAAVFGACGSAIGALASALVPKLPAGAVIVVTNSFFFAVSLTLGGSRGLVVRLLEHWKLTQKVRHQHLMRALVELEEDSGQPVIDYDRLYRARSWNHSQLRRNLNRARSQGLLKSEGSGFQLTPQGEEVARRVVRNHRLWELYLIHYADIAPSHVDRDADQVEHVLDAETIDRLEELLQEDHPVHSPHPLELES